MLTYEPANYSHPERQSSSTNHPSQRSSSLELFARDLQRNQRFRLGLRTGLTLVGSTTPRGHPERERR